MTSHLDDTIAALSTAPGEAGIAVVRVSGAEACTIAGGLFRGARKSGNPGWEHRRLYHGHILSPQGDTIDEVVVGVFRAPESYTGEDVVEISCHGGPVVVSRLLDALYTSGARAAEPGEFTRRAFVNGKMDLIQAEAVADMIHAHSELQQRVAQRQLAGGLSETIGALAHEMMTLLGDVEANIDFIEDGIETIRTDDAVALVERQIAALDTLLESAPLSRPFREGYHVVIAGPVNAGKSSLFNRLAQAERAIVTDIPGTTRDVLREHVLLSGLLFVFNDTAGLRETGGDRVEQIGMTLTADALRHADLVLFVLDASVPAPPDALRALQRLNHAHTLVVLNKRDLPAPRGGDPAQAIGEYRSVSVSALTGTGIDELRRRMVTLVGGDTLSRVARERFVLNARLVSLMRQARERAGELRAALVERRPLELLAADVREVLTRYEEATGQRYQDDLLDVIFSRFCLGK